MTVYVITSLDYGDFEVVAVFMTQEAADKAAAELRTTVMHRGCAIEVEPFEVREA